jgi:transposase
MGRRGYPPAFRRKVLDLVEAGRPIAEVAKALGISAQSVSSWRRQDRIDKGLLPGLSSHEHDELRAARQRRIAQLEIELAGSPGRDRHHAGRHQADRLGTLARP